MLSMQVITMPLLQIGSTSIVGLLASSISHVGTHYSPPLTTLLSGAGFLYLWWLAILVFDLVFIWHRYIRQSMARKLLHEAFEAYKYAAKKS